MRTFYHNKFERNTYVLLPHSDRKVLYLARFLFDYNYYLIVTTHMQNPFILPNNGTLKFSIANSDEKLQVHILRYYLQKNFFWSSKKILLTELKERVRC